MGRLLSELWFSIDSKETGNGVSRSNEAKRSLQGLDSICYLTELKCLSESESPCKGHSFSQCTEKGVHHGETGRISVKASGTGCKGLGYGGHCGQISEADRAWNPKEDPIQERDPGKQGRNPKPRSTVWRRPAASCRYRTRTARARVTRLAT